MRNLSSRTTPRRTLLALAALLGAARVETSNAQPLAMPTPERLSWLPNADHPGGVFVWRLTLKLGQTRSRWQPGRASIMVESGVMTATAFVPGETVVRVGGPTLPPIAEGTPASWTSPPFQPPEFTQGFGFVAEDGDFGTIENSGTEDLVVIVIVEVSYPT
jgi:hypothetical protein